jgi:hypothetical protein
VIDWCERSIFIPRSIRRRVNEDLYRAVDAIADMMSSQLEHPLALYVGGSLARREPAVSIAPPHRLVSDIDVVAVVGNGVDPVEITKLESAISSKIAGTKVGIVAVPAGSIHRASSFFAADLAAAMGFLLDGSLPVDPPSPHLRRRDRVELIVHQVSSCLVHTGSLTGRPEDFLLRPTGAYHRVKLPLECLRATMANLERDDCSYASVHHRRHEPECSFVLPPEVVERLIRSRELFDSDPSPPVDVAEVVTRALAAIFDTPSEATSVLRRLFDTMVNDRDLLSVYQLSCLALFLKERTSDRFSERVIAPSLCHVWAHMDTSDLVSGRSAMQILARLRPEHTSSQRDVVLHCLRQIRLDYYRELGDHIFGIRPRTGYSELA